MVASRKPETASGGADAVSVEFAIRGRRTRSPGDSG